MSTSNEDTNSLESQKNKKFLYKNETTGEIGTAEEIFSKAKATDVVSIYKSKSDLSYLGRDSIMEYGLFS